MNVELLKKVKKIICHGGGCPDGIASALLLKDALPDAEVVFLNYNEPAYEALAPEEGTLWCDLVPYCERDKDGNLTVRGAEQGWAWANAEPIVLDHHKTNKVVMLYFGALGVFADEEDQPGVSGAVLAYEEVWAPLHPDNSTHAWADATGASHSNGTCQPGWIDAVGYFAELVAVRDTFQTKDARWRQACAASAVLAFWPTVELLAGGLASTMDLCLRSLGGGQPSLGEVLLQKQAAEDAKTIAEALRFTVRDERVPLDEHGDFRGPIREYRVVAFEGQSRAASDVAQALGDEADLVLAWHYTATHLKVSCRTRGTFPVEAFAKAFGGGGHGKAAGFHRTLTPEGYAPQRVMPNMVEVFLSAPRREGSAQAAMREINRELYKEVFLNAPRYGAAAEPSPQCHKASET